MSDDQDDAQKTEDPTPKKLEEARKKGNVALSREVNNWLMLLAGTVLIVWLSPYMLGNLMEIMKSMIANSHKVQGTPGGMNIALGEGAKAVLMALAFPFLFFFLAAFLGPFSQVGPMFSPGAIKPELSKISVVKGFKRLFSVRSLMEFAKGILKISIVGVVGTIILYPYMDKMEHLVGQPLLVVLFELKFLFVRLMIGVLIVTLIVALVDIVFQQNEHMKKMRMTKQEVKDEYKQTEGDPQVKSRLRQLRAERGRQRMMQAVPEADVVITNPTHYSIALKYDTDTMEAPVCVAKGINEVALRIREIAKENDVILYENKPLARALFDTIDIDEMVPPEHFKAVAEVISYVFKLRKSMKR